MKINPYFLFISLLPLLSLMIRCDDFSFFDEADKSISDKNNPLIVTPASITLAQNTQAIFSAADGIPPYAFAVVSGAGTGSIDSASGLYTAPVLNPGDAYITASIELPMPTVIQGRRGPLFTPS